MPDPNGIYTLALDFDGTAAEGWPGKGPLRWRPDAKALILGARAAGVRVVLHTCRAIPGPDKAAPGQFRPDVEAEEFLRFGRVPAFVSEGWDLREQVLRFLEAEGVADAVELWEGPGKPMADVYADDLAEGADLATVAAALGVSLADGQRLAEEVGERTVGAAPGAAA